MFCPKCGSLLMPSGGKMKCSSCNHTAEDGKILDKKKKEEKIEVVDKKEREKTLPTMRATCDKCGNELAFFHTMQTRSADEPETKFYKCTKCGHNWREY